MGYYTQKFINFWNLKAGVLLRSYLCYMGVLVFSLGLLAFTMNMLNAFEVVSDKSMKFLWNDGFDYCTLVALLTGFGYFVRKVDQIGWVYRMKQRHRAEMDRVRAMEDLARVKAEDRN